MATNPDEGKTSDALAAETLNRNHPGSLSSDSSRCSLRMSPSLSVSRNQRLVLLLNSTTSRLESGLL